MIDNKQLLTVLRHIRHDWLNKIQLIKGNLALNKVERVNEIIEQIVIEAQNEAKLTGLSMPLFASLLISHHWETHAFSLEYEILGEIRDLSSYDEKITTWCKSLFKHLDQNVQEGNTNHLCISIDMKMDEVRFFFDFSGIINDVILLKKWLDDHHDLVPMEQSAIHNHEWTICLVFKLTED